MASKDEKKVLAIQKKKKRKGNKANAANNNNNNKAKVGKPSMRFMCASGRRRLSAAIFSPIAVDPSIC